MRERKFRAWDKYEKRMLYRNIFDRNWYATPANNENGCNCVRGITPEDKSNIELMQYTDLKDKNGVEIYEGDIVRIGTYFNFEEDESGWVDESIHEVVWGMEQGYPAFDLKPWVDCDTNALQLYASICNESAAIEVIGNIYEHPHLLEDKR